jgi:serine protease Do
VQVQEISSADAKGWGLPDTSGAQVVDVLSGSPAEKAGIERGDVIRAVDGRTINDSADLPPIIGNMAPGTKAKVTVIRDGRTIDKTVVVNELDELAGNGRATPRPAPDEDSSKPSGGNALGLVGQDLSAGERQRLGLGKGEGVLIRNPGDSGAEAGLRPGDVVLQVGRNAVGTSAALDRELGSVKSGDTVMLLVRRQGSTQFIAVTAQDEAQTG